MSLVLFTYLERSVLLEDALTNELIIFAVFKCAINEQVDVDLGNE